MVSGPFTCTLLSNGLRRATPPARSLRSPPSDYKFWGSGVRISSGYRTGHSKTCRFCARCGDERAQQYAFRAHDANFFRVHFDALGERAEVIATVAAAVGAHSFAGLSGERFESL